MTVFATIFLLLIFILVIVSFFALARRHRCSAGSKRDQRLSASTADWDLEAQGDRDGSFTEKTPRSMGFSALYVWAFSWTSRRSLVGTTGSSLPLPVSASSAGGSTFARRLTDDLLSSSKKACLKVKVLSRFVVSGANGFLALARKSWNAISSYDADLEAGGLVPHSPTGEAPRIIVTMPSDEGIAFEALSPASTYSEPDSPTVETPDLASPVEVRVYEGPLEGDYATSVQLADHDDHHAQVDLSDACIEPKDFLITAYGFGFETYTEQREKGDGLIGAFIALLSSESLSDRVEDGDDEGIEEKPYEAHFEDTIQYVVEVEPGLKHADSCSAIVHWWHGPSSSEPHLVPEPSLNGIADDLGHLEADGSFYSCSSASFARNVDDRGFGCDFAISPATSGEVYHDCYG
ncbi:hypothetical protein C8Q79DRAFT_1104908 [Trametes meyenii]|nr:hypothetical protein C8Q79DRAFT_1104908 [Trametes meyenii]